MLYNCLVIVQYSQQIHSFSKNIIGINDSGMISFVMVWSNSIAVQRCPNRLAHLNVHMANNNKVKKAVSHFEYDMLSKYEGRTPTT